MSRVVQEKLSILARTSIEIADKFIQKVDSGRAKSVETYADMKRLKGVAETFLKDLEPKPVVVNRNVSDREKKVLTMLAEHYDAWEGRCVYTRTIAKETELTIEQARRSVKALVRKGLAEYHRGLFDDDGMVAGSGYCASKEGALLVNACKDCKTNLADMVTGQCQECWEKHEGAKRRVELGKIGIPTLHLWKAKVSLCDLDILKKHYEKEGVPEKLTNAGALKQINALVKEYQRHYSI